jgi:heterotetrameric sarcosine oxidase gamma subunit
VADLSLAARSAFSELSNITHDSFSANVRDDLAMVSIAAGKGKAAAVRDAMRAAYGLELPDTPRRVEGKDISIIWHGTDQWIAIAERGAAERDLEAELTPVLAGIAAIVDQGDGRAVVRVSGAHVRDVLAKGLGIDLHPRAFAENGVAITHASHIGIVLWQTSPAPVYEIAMFRSFADSFARWLTHSAAEFIGH